MFVLGHSLLEGEAKQIGTVVRARTSSMLGKYEERVAFSGISVLQ